MQIPAMLESALSECAFDKVRRIASAAKKWRDYPWHAPAVACSRGSRVAVAAGIRETTIAAATPRVQCTNPKVSLVHARLDEADDNWDDDDGLDQDDESDVEEDGDEEPTVACPHCGREIHEDARCVPTASNISPRKTRRVLASRGGSSRAWACACTSSTAGSSDRMHESAQSQRGSTRCMWSLLVVVTAPGPDPPNAL